MDQVILGNASPTQYYVGSSPVDRVYLGNTLMHQAVEIYPKDQAPNGVYILTTDLYCVKREDYATVGKEGMGIAIIQDDLRVVTAYELIKSVAWSPLEVDITTLGYYETSTDARTVTAEQAKSYNEKMNSSVWLNTSINAKAREYSKGSLSAGSWYVPSVSQLDKITINNWLEARKIFELFGTNEPSSSYDLWTIVQQSEGMAWCIHMMYTSTAHSLRVENKKATSNGSKILCLLPVADL